MGNDCCADRPTVDDQSKHPPPNYTKDKGLTVPQVQLAAKAPPALQKDGKYWLDYSKPRPLKALGKLVDPIDNWKTEYCVGSPDGMSAEQTVQRLFIEVEAKRRTITETFVQPGMLSWQGGDVIEVIRLLFDRVEFLPEPRLSQQAWDALWLMSERDGRNQVDLVHCTNFARFFCRELYRLAKGGGTEKTHAEIAPNVYIPAAKGIDPQWHKTYAKHADKMASIVDNWDGAHIKDTVAKDFAAVDKDGDMTLQWNNSEVQQFIARVFQEHNLPLPPLTQSQWYQIFRTFSADRYEHSTSGMDKEACEGLANFIHSEIKRGDTDLHEVTKSSEVKPASQSGSQPASQPVAHPEVAAAVHARDWRQSAEAKDIKTGFPKGVPLHSEEIRKAFSEVDVDGDGALHWNNSEIKNFVHGIFTHMSLPQPQVPESVWYQWYRECDVNQDGAMEIEEAIEFAKHVFTRILQLNGRDEYIPPQPAPQPVQPAVVYRQQPVYQQPVYQQPTVVYTQQPQVVYSNGYYR